MVEGATRDVDVDVDAAVGVGRGEGTASLAVTALTTTPATAMGFCLDAELPLATSQVQTASSCAMLLLMVVALQLVVASFRRVQPLTASLCPVQRQVFSTVPHPAHTASSFAEASLRLRASTTRATIPVHGALGHRRGGGASHSTAQTRPTSLATAAWHWVPLHDTCR